MKILLLSVVFCVAQFTEGSRVLVVFPFPSRSHGILGAGIVKQLLDDGHEVTYVTTFPINKSVPNLRQIHISENQKFIQTDQINLKLLLDKTAEPMDISGFFGNILNMSKETISNPDFKKILLTEEFDLVIVEWMFNTFLSGLGEVFNCPFVWFSSVDPHVLVLELIDEIPNPSYNAGILSQNIAPFSFQQRVMELLGLTFIKTFKAIFFDPKEAEAYDEIIGPIVKAKGRVLAPYQQVKYNSSLMLGNSHVSLGAATRLPQIYKPIGGYHISSHTEPLPENLKKIMDNSKHGVIYFSMGSNLKSKELPEVIKKDLLKMFGTLKQTVFWKFEEVMPDLPGNVHILQWAPQPGILAHPNCVLFITHGGLLSTTETIHFGVPIIGIPAFADQFTNVGRAVNRGFAKKVDLTYDVAKDLKIAIEESLNDPKMKAKVKELSFVYHDRPASPGAELRHWVRHVIATRGAPHLRSPALLVPWYQKIYLDLSILILVIIVILFKIVKILFSCCKSTKKLKKN